MTNPAIKGQGFFLHVTTEVRKMSIHEDVLNNVSVLIVEDEKVIREGLHFYLKKRVADIYLAGNVEEALEIYRTKRPQIIISDLTMLPILDLQMAETIRQKDKETIIILVSANNEQDYFIRAIEIGINRYVPRPANKDELLETLIVEAYKVLLRQEIKVVEKKLESTRRFEGLLQLIKGLAHNFNNILVGIIGYVGLIQIKLRESETLSREDIQHEINIVESSAEKAATLIQKLFTLSNYIDCPKESVKLNVIVRISIDNISPKLPHGINITTCLADASLLVMANIGYLSQMIVSLLENALEAMPDGGTLEILTTREGQWAVVEIRDSGCGMDEVTMDKVFDPFFTTKGLVSHLGLGMSIAKGIVEEHGGYIDVSSEINRGSIFKIHLPLLRNEVFSP